MTGIMARRASGGNPAEGIRPRRSWKGSGNGRRIGGPDNSGQISELSKGGLHEENKKAPPISGGAEDPIKDFQQWLQPLDRQSPVGS